MLQVTGGSLEESKEALAIAETDGHFMHSTLQYKLSGNFISLQAATIIANNVGLLIITARLFCTVGVHPTRCKVTFHT